jgi:hypothetical protein
VLDLVVSVPFLRWFLVIAYAVTMLVQLSSLVILQMDDSVWFARLVTSALLERRLQFYCGAKNAARRKDRKLPHANACVVRGAGETLLLAVAGEMMRAGV